MAELPSGIKGADNRERVDGSAPPWQAIGRIHKAGMGFCTGTLIKPDRVLTAAHCIWNPVTDQPVPGQYLHFVAGYHRESYLAASTVKRVVHSGGFHLGSPVQLDAVEHDWAILELDQPIRSIPPLPVELRTAKELAGLIGGQQLIQAGFSKDRPYILTVDRSCHVKGKLESHQLISHDCDAIHGDSGSPIMLELQQGMTIVAIHTATQHVLHQESLGLAVPTAAVDFSR